MWVIETDGDIFQGKRLWLRPGKRFLFGRTKAGEDDFAVSDKTISRHHLLVEVDEVLPAECGNHRSRSKVTLTDQGTKIGTILNGEQIKCSKENKVGHVLQKDVNVVTIGRYPHELRIVWVPVNLTFSFASKEVKANPWTRLHERLGPLDIKVLHDYEVGITTHLAARKRNTAKGLQALIDGKFIVDNETYIQALVDAATSTSGPSPLEQDFENNFPDPAKYLPARGDEPTQRSADTYAPDANRKEMFSGYTFVFYEKKQHDSLAAPIFLGGGKAILRAVTPNETDVLDFIRYVKSVAGEKGLGEFEDGSEGKGVVVVRFNPMKGPDTEWFKNFTQDVSIRLDHRSVEQNEFLDAILGADARVLRRPLEEPEPSFAGEPTSGGTIKSSDTIQSSPQTTRNEAPAQATMAPPVQAARGGRRRGGGTKFKGFDVDDDVSFVPSSFQGSMDLDPAPAASMELSQGLFVSQDQSQGMFVTQQSQQPQPLSHDNDDDPDALLEGIKSPSPSPGPGRNPRKRPAPSEEDVFLDNIAPAAAAAKKRRVDDAAVRRRDGLASPPPKPVVAKVEPVRPVVKPKKKIVDDDDFMEKVRTKREKADIKAREEREALERGLEEMDLSEIRKLVIVEGMKIGRTSAPPQIVPRADESERWEDKWNGRKNFKKFKRRGGEQAPVRRNIIVKVAEANLPDYGIGMDHWLGGEKEKESQHKTKKGKKKDTQEVSQSQSLNKGKGKAVAKVSVEPSDDEMLSDSDVEIIARPTARKAAAAKSQSTSQRATTSKTQTQTQTQTLVDKTHKTQNVPASSAGSKRPAASALTKPAPAKKAKKVPVREESVEEDDSDDDGLAFKFRRR